MTVTSSHIKERKLDVGFVMEERHFPTIPIKAKYFNISLITPTPQWKRRTVRCKKHLWTPEPNSRALFPPRCRNCLWCLKARVGKEGTFVTTKGKSKLQNKISPNRMRKYVFVYGARFHAEKIHQATWLTSLWKWPGLRWCHWQHYH